MNSTQAEQREDFQAGVDRLMDLLHVARAMEERVEKALAEVELSGAKFGVLGHLVEAREAIPLSELANRVNCVRSNVTQMVDRLEAEGLVRRSPSGSDRRIILAELTESGRTRHGAGVQRLALLEQEISGAVSEEELASALRIMRAFG